MPFPISLIFDFLVKRGAKEATAGPVSWMLAAVIAIGIVVGAISAYNAWIVDNHETVERADKAEKTIEQIETAEGVDEQLRTEDEKLIEELEDIVDEGTRQDPERDTTAVDPSTSAVHDRMRQYGNSRSSR